jgi:hypothetical protein
MKNFGLLLATLALLCLLPLAAYSGPGPGPAFDLTMQVYPNPNSSGNFVLEIQNLHPQDEVFIKVFNLIGTEIIRQHTTAFSGDFRTAINLTTAPKGIYLLEVTIGEKKQTRRLSYI